MKLMHFCPKITPDTITAHEKIGESQVLMMDFFVKPTKALGNSAVKT